MKFFLILAFRVQTYENISNFVKDGTLTKSNDVNGHFVQKMIEKMNSFGK